VKKLFYLLFIFAVLLMSWDFSSEDLTVSAKGSVIPDQAIRLRIIANSDSPEDQWIKRKVRDVISAEVAPWVGTIEDIDQARAIIGDHLPELEQLVKQTLVEYGFSYDKAPVVELGIVPFPTKLYGQIVYPAGDYEALRITLGNAEGQNWWCVLFPPLCFVDMSSGDAVEVINEDKLPLSKEKEEKETSSTTGEDVEVRFFLVEAITKMVEFFKGIF